MATASRQFFWRADGRKRILFLPFSSDFLASFHEDHFAAVRRRLLPPEIRPSILSLSNLQKNKFNKNHPLVKERERYGAVLVWLTQIENASGSGVCF
jgi:hypothetical protein